MNKTHVIAVIWDTPNIVPGYDFTVHAITGKDSNGVITGFTNHRAKTKEDAVKLANDINKYWNEKNEFPPCGLFPQMVG